LRFAPDIVKALASKEHAGQQILALAPFALFLIQAVLLLPEHRMLWGIENVFYRYGQGDGFLSNTILRVYYSPDLAGKVLTTHLVCCFLALVPVSIAALPRLIAWLTALMLYAAAPSAFGWTMPFLLSVSAVSIGLCLKTTGFDQIGLRYWLHQLLRAQSLLWIIAFVALAWGNDQWRHGETFYYAIHHDAAVRHWVIENRTWLSRLSVVCTYAMLMYTTLLPAILLLNRFRYMGIIVGIMLLCVYTLVFNNVMNALILGMLLLPWAIKPPAKQDAS
jgi:hypothetical protein